MDAKREKYINEPLTVRSELYLLKLELYNSAEDCTKNISLGCNQFDWPMSEI